MYKVALDQELAMDSFKFARLNKDNVVISYGPKNGFLWRGEEANPDDLIGSLKKVFQTGFTPGNEQSPLAKLPYIQSHLGFICASYTDDELIGFDNEQLSAGMYGYIYLIDTTSHNMESIPLCNENLGNSAFVQGYIGEQLSEGPDFAFISKVDSKYIIGAIPSSKEVTCALRIEEKSFIKNSAYKKVFYFEKISEVIGKEFILITSDKLYDSEGQKFKVAKNLVQSSLSTTANTTFFNRQLSTSELGSTSAYNSHLKF